MPKEKVVLGAAGGLLGATIAYYWYTKEPRVVEFTDKQILEKLKTFTAGNSSSKKENQIDLT